MNYDDSKNQRMQKCNELVLKHQHKIKTTTDGQNTNM